MSDRLRDRLEGLYVDRIIVPERPRFPGGYLKGEWVLRLTGRKGEAQLLLSIRPRHPGLALLEGKGPRAAPEGTRSAFDLALSKHLRGLKVLGVETVARERTAVIWFASDSLDSYSRLGLALTLIPAVPEAILFGDSGAAPYPVITRSRVGGASTFEFPDGAKAPPHPEVREALVATPENYTAAIEAALGAEAFAARLAQAQRALRELLGQARDRIRQSGTAAQEGEREPDWQRYGDLLKSVLGSPPPLEQRILGAPKDPKWVRVVPDYFSEEDGAACEIPGDPQITPSVQVEKFYQLARRKQRRISEARARLEDFQELAHSLEQALESVPREGDWAALEALEKSARIERRRPSATAPGGPHAGGQKKKAASWLGKSFVSKDGWTIWVGRSKDENLELTFKHARGNDLWMHVRGRPGAHAVIPVQPGKSVPLETLLDAACLTVYYSNGEKWGKTEVDYTFKKHVKRIKDSTEASYTHNKTLIVEPDAARIKRLLGQAIAK